MVIRNGAGRLLLGWFLLGGISAAQADVFINEIHYDNNGTDVGEAIEVVAPAGTSLAGWSIQLYNGGNGTRYATLPLSGATADQCNGWGTVSVAAPGIQNGAPDGMALVNASGVAVQLLSYEGSFTATDGPASGMAASAITPSETSSTAAGHSLQLTGSGSSSSDFAWQAPATASFGACNSGQNFTGGGTGGGGGGSTGNVLSNGVAVTGLAASSGDSLAYTLDVPAGATDLSIAISGGSGDADLYLRFGSAPTTSSYDCRPYLGGNNESCAVAVPQAGTYYVMARAYSSFSGVSLIGSFTAPTGGGGGGGGGTELVTAIDLGSLSASTGTALNYTFEVPAGASDLAVVMSGGSGDADLYLRQGAAPTTSSYDCRPYKNGNAETCSVAAPAAGTWYVMLRAYSSFSGLSLKVSFTAPVVGGGGGGGGGGGDPATYYDGVDASSPAALRASLHDTIDDHTKFPYSATETDTWDVLEFADQDPLDASRILDIYKNTSYAKATGGNTFYNREHTWPKSYGFPTDGPDNYPYTDTHMLMLSEIDYNAARGNLPFGNCNASCTEYPTTAYASQGGGSGTFPGNSNWSNGAIWQVWSKLKGDVARAVLYMDVRYEGGVHGVTGYAEPNLILTDNMSLVTGTGSNASVAYMGSLSTLLQWDLEDPVSESERLRNDAVYSYQGNRNPFVDHPEWTSCVFRNICN